MSQPHIFIATHHKSGTVWMLNTFRRIAKANGYQYVRLNEGEIGWDMRADKAEYFEKKRIQCEAEADGRGVFFDFHSDFPDLTRCKQERGAKGIHLVRDPRDMLVSAVRFHLISNEIWLHRPNPAFGGMTYQQKMLSYNTLEDRIKLEIDHHMGETIRRMGRFEDQGVFRTVRYEDLIVDVDMILFHELMVYLEVRGRALINALDSFWVSSVFGERSKSDVTVTRNHIFNSQPEQWVAGLEPGVLDLIERTFEYEIRELGYRFSDETC